MIVWRLQRATFREHWQSGEGARRFPGRWNSAGTPLVYCATTPELAVLEMLVHTDPDLIPDDLEHLEIQLPDTFTAETLEARTLPADWRRHDEMHSTRKHGDQFQRSRQHLGLIVPSAILPLSSNILLNPHHPAIADCRLLGHHPFTLDQRLEKHGKPQ